VSNNIGKNFLNHLKSGIEEPGKPLATKPATREIRSYNDQLMADIESTRQPQQRAPKLLELAQQLGSLSTEKSGPTKTVEGLHRTAAFIARASSSRTVTIPTGVNLIPTRNGQFDLEITGVKVHNAKLLPTQRDLGSMYATPQKKHFDFLMSSLARPDRHESSKKLRFMSLTYKFDVKVKTTTADKAEIDRRIAYGPVWGEMLKHASALKSDRQDKLLKGFKECFADLPGQTLMESQQGIPSAKTNVVRASGESFKNLATALADLGDSAHTDKLSDRQKTAIELLKTLRDDMSPEQRTGVVDAFDKILPKAGADNRIPLTLELEVMALRRHFGEA
jgi:hypothetical protein